MVKKSKLENNYEKRDELKIMILKLLKINDNNRSFSLFEIDSDEDLQKQIFELENFCEKYFSVKSWSHFRNKQNGRLNNRTYLTFIRNIFNFCNIEYYNKQTSMLINNNVVYYVKYTIL